MCRCIEVAVVLLLRWTGFHAWSLEEFGGRLGYSAHLLPVAIGVGIGMAIAVALAVARPGGRKEDQ